MSNLFDIAQTIISSLAPESDVHVTVAYVCVQESLSLDEIVVLVDILRSEGVNI